MFYVFMLLFETFKNRLDRFVLVGRKRLERRELEQIGVLELFNRMNRVVFFAKLWSRGLGTSGDTEAAQNNRIGHSRCWHW